MKCHHFCEKEGSTTIIVFQFVTHFTIITAVTNINNENRSEKFPLQVQLWSLLHSFVVQEQIWDGTCNMIEIHCKLNITSLYQKRPTLPISCISQPPPMPVPHRLVITGWPFSACTRKNCSNWLGISYYRKNSKLTSICEPTFIIWWLTVL